MDNNKKFTAFFNQSFGALSKYVIGKLISSTIIFLLAGFILKALGIKLSFVIGIIMGVGNLIPIFGIWIGIIVSAIIALAQNINEPIHILYVVGIGLILQIIDEFIISPLVVGKAVDLKPLVIILAIYGGGFLFGFWGIVLAVPCAVIIKIAYNVFLKKKSNQNQDSNKEKRDESNV